MPVMLLASNPAYSGGLHFCTARGDDFRPQAEAVHRPVKHVTYGKIAAATSAKQAAANHLSDTHDER